MPDFRQFLGGAWKLLLGKFDIPVKLAADAGSPTVAGAKQVKDEVIAKRPARHLVIYRAAVMGGCPSCDQAKQVEFFAAKSFDSLVEAEIFRSNLLRSMGGEARLVSGARICARFSDLLKTWSPQNTRPLVDFLAFHFSSASSPALN